MLQTISNVKYELELSVYLELAEGPYVARRKKMFKKMCNLPFYLLCPTKYGNRFAKTLHFLAKQINAKFLKNANIFLFFRELVLHFFFSRNFALFSLSFEKFIFVKFERKFSRSFEFFRKVFVRWNGNPKIRPDKSEECASSRFTDQIRHFLSKFYTINKRKMVKKSVLQNILENQVTSKISISQTMVNSW